MRALLIISVCTGASLAPLSLLSAQPAGGQAQSPATIQGAIRGTLADPSGSAIPAATVSLSGANTEKSAQTAADGSYSFAGLPAGDYTIKVDYPGLDAFEQQATLQAGRTLQIPIQLKLRVSTQAVTVTGDRDAELNLDPGGSTGVTVVKDSDLDALPDDPGDLNDMLQTLAGPGGAQILVDGFSGGQLPPKNTIKEIRVDRSRFSSDNDSSFSQIEIVTKPGADKFHGSAALTDSDAVFNSRNPYAANKADYVNRTFTGTVAGSIRQRASYIFSFYRSTLNNTALINAVTLDPATFLPAPVRSTVVVPRNDLSGTARLDDQISTNHTFTGSYRYLQSHRDNNGVGQFSLESRGYSSENTTSEVHLAETAVLSSHMVTDTRFGFTRNTNHQYGDTSTPSLIVSAAFNGGGSQTGQTSNVNTLVEVQSNTSVVRNTHTIRFGGRLRHNSIQDISPSNFGGTFSFFGVTDAPVLDAKDQPVGNETAQISSLEQYRRTLLFESLGYSAALIRSLGGGASQFSIAAGNPLVRFSQTDLGVYLNDDWRARPNLTLTLGLRYETQTNIHDWRDFGPRLALAWSPGAKKGAAPKTVIRAGSGLFYARVDPSYTQQALRFNGTNERQYVVLNPDFYPLAPPLGTLANSQPSTTYEVDPHMKAAASLFTELSVERQLPGKNSVSLSYFNQRTAHSFYRQSVNINAPLPGTYVAEQDAGIRPYGEAAGNIFQYESGIIQKVQWIAVHLNTKLGQKLSLSTDYSLMDAHNDGDFDRGLPPGPQCACAYPSNPYNRSMDWGPASWSGEWVHTLTVYGTLMAPGGVQLSPFFLSQSGTPYNVTIGSDLNGDTVVNDRPAFATDLSRPSVVVTKFGAFDTDPLPGQTLVPRNYLMGAPMWNINLRVSRALGFGKPKEPPPSGYKGPPQHRYGLNFNIDVTNLFNYLNQGGYVGNLSSPLFGQSTSINLFTDRSNNRRIQFGTQFTF